MIRVISSFADGPVNFHSTGPAEDQIQKLISSTVSQGSVGNTRFTRAGDKREAQKGMMGTSVDREREVMGR